MRFWKGPAGALALAVTLAVGVGVATLTIRVQQAMRPSRQAEASLDVAALLFHVEEVRFRSSDGVDLAGWLIPGTPELPAIVLCHDLGASKSSLLNLAVPLHKAGFTLLAFDFRGHGKSGGSRSSFGLVEKRDVIGAVDYLLALDHVDAKRLGIFGVGMGAFAATLAALDRPALRVIVLDGLYPDVGYPLVRRVYENWSFGVRHLGLLPQAVFRVIDPSARKGDRASAVLPSLVGRDVLMVAPAGDTALAKEMESMYRSIPEQRGADGNLVILPATLSTGLYGEDLERYLNRVCAFFQSRLTPPTARMVP